MSRCFICGEDNDNVLQTHHIVPRRYGGSDASENLVDLCANCHQAIEAIYNDDVFRRMGVTKTSDEDSDGKRSDMDRFIEMLGRAISDGVLVDGEDYVIIHEGKPNETVCVKMGRAFDQVVQYAREQGVLDPGATFSDIKFNADTEARYSSIIDVSKQTRKLNRTVAFDGAAVPLKVNVEA